MKHLTLSSFVAALLCVVMSTPAFAHDAIVDGIYYNLDTHKKVAEVTFVGNYNEYNYYYVEHVEIPTSIIFKEVKYTVNRIGAHAFRNCNDLTAVTIPETIDTIDAWAFHGCSGLERITIASGNKNYDSRDNCNAIIEKETKTLMQGCMNTKIPATVEYINEYAFYNCKNLTAVTLPTALKGIGRYAFFGCSKLTKVTIPDNITSIESGTFAGCGDLTSVTIPHSVKTIGSSAFEGCRSLVGITIPNSVTSIHREAFSGCTALASFTVPSSVVTMGEDIFMDCNSLASVTFNCPKAHECFSGLTSLTTVAFGSSVRNVLPGAFKNCTNLKKAYLNEGLQAIGAEAFEGTALASIDIPSTVISIGENAFANCANLKTVTSLITAPFTIDESVFASQNIDLLVPTTCKDAYTAAPGWTGFASIKETDVTAIAALRTAPAAASQLFTFDGRRLSNLHPGLNIISNSRTTRKVMVR